MKPALSTPDDLHLALGFIDNAVKSGRWAEARRWIRAFVPAIEMISLKQSIAAGLTYSEESTRNWFNVMRSGTELGRLLVREEKRAYPAQMADVMACLSKASQG